MQQAHGTCSSWLCRSQAESRSQLEEAWPQLSSQNEIRLNVRRSEGCSNMSNCNRTNLNDLEYPHLGEKKSKCRTTTDSHISYRNVVPMTFEKVKTNHKKMIANRYRRTERICIDLKEALENAKCLKISNKRAKKMKISIYKGNSDPNNPSTNKKSVEVKKIKVYVTKAKKPSKLKKTVLIERQLKNEARKQKCLANNKTEENAVDVNNINFNTLKIIADPEIDVDYVKGMSALTFYGTNYRNVQQENIVDDSIEFRPDLLEKLDSLAISNVNNKNISTASYRNIGNNFNDAIDTDALQRTLSLQDDDIVDRKPNINDNEFENSEIKYSNTFREYCNHMITPTLNESLDKFLCEIKRLQMKLYDRDHNKGKYKRRYYSGLKEVQKHITFRKVKFVIFAPDIEKIQSKGGLDEEVHKLLEICREHEVVYCFGLRRRKLGYYAHGNGFAACIGITNYSGSEELFRNVLIEVIRARNKFKELCNESNRMIDISKILSENLPFSEDINNLLKILASHV